jgi:hypothetical protein
VEGVAGGEDDVVGFGEVVIFGGQPEDGDGAPTAASKLAGDPGIGVLGAADDGGGFEEGEEGSAEEGDLLAGEDGAGSVAEALDVSSCFIGGGAGAVKPAVILFEEEVGECVAVGWVLLGDVVGPGGRPGCGGEERGEGVVARGVVEEEPALPGQERDGITVDLHGWAYSEFLMRAERTRKV